MAVNVTLNSVADLTNTVTSQQTINANSTAIVQAFTSAVNITGDKMQGNLDLNSNRILNLPVPSSANEPARLADVISTSIPLSFPLLGGVVTSTATSGNITTTFSGAGNLPVAQLAGGVNANNGSFWRGDGTWSSVASVGITAGTGIVIVASGTLSNISVSASVPLNYTNDANVTMTETNNTLTLGWTGVLPLSRGGANNNPVASAGGQVFSNATGFAISTAATTANQMWLSAVTGTPVLSTSVWPADCNTNQILVCSTSHTWSASQTVSNLTLTSPTLTTATMTGTTVLQNATMSGSLTFSTGTIGVVGCTDTSSGVAGNIGELISTTVLSASASALSNGTASNIMAISLTPGDWDVFAHHVFTTGTVITQITQLGGSINSTTVFNAVAGGFVQNLYPATTTFSSTGNVAMWTGPFRVSIAATATYQNVMQANFATGSVSAWGSMRARRIR